MISTPDQSLTLLEDIVSQPTAPYHEEQVAARVLNYLRRWDVPCSVDEGGNIIAHYRRGPACRPLILMAHMDHPACTIAVAGGPRGAEWTATLEGGVPPSYFGQPVAVRIHTADRAASAAGIAARSISYTQDPETRVLSLHLKLDNPASASSIRPGDFATWDLPDFAVREGVIHARAIDDLAGCAAMLLTIGRAAREQWDTDLYAVFTRAEEVGLVGAYVALGGSLLPREGYLVSLEASKALPGAVQGGGPVIRVGDRLTTFSQDAELVLKSAAQSLGLSIRHFRPAGDADEAGTTVQRQLMSGGACEASLAVLMGYEATGLAFPLGNYHNMGEGSVLAAENIHASDFLTGVSVLQEAARLLPEIRSLRAKQLAAREPDAAKVERLRASSLPTGWNDPEANPAPTGGNA